MRVEEITNFEYPSIYEDETVTKARAILRDFSIRMLPITNLEKRLLGVITRRDVMVISSSKSLIKVMGVMTHPKHVAQMGDDAYQTVRRMIKVGEWYVPLVNSATEKVLLGVIGLENFIEQTIRHSPEKLALPVSEAMTTNVLTCSPEDEVDDVWRLMQEKAIAGLPVTLKGKLVGILTQKDLLESGFATPTFESDKGRFRSPTKVANIMKTQVIAVRPEVKAIRVAKVMVSKDIGRVPVVDKDKKLLGIVDREDIVKIIIGK